MVGMVAPRAASQSTKPHYFGQCFRKTDRGVKSHYMYKTRSKNLVHSNNQMEGSLAGKGEGASGESPLSGKGTFVQYRSQLHVS